tara:strand:- start:1094 stop:2101 length:1008 start_codon:yes stop_codon:yes gene_type:complete
MIKNKFLDKFNKTTIFLSLLILVLLYILYIHNTNYNNLFENFSLITNDFVNPCDKGYPHFYMSSNSYSIHKPNADEVSCNFLCDTSNDCKFYTISGEQCHNYNIIDLDISVNCNKKDTIISGLSDKYIGIGFIRNVDDINLLKYHDQHLYTVNELLNNKDSLDTQLSNIYMNSISNEYITTISNNMLSDNNDNIDTWGYLNVSGVRIFKNQYLQFIDDSFNSHLDDLSLNRGYNGWSYLTEISNNNGDISDNYPNPKRSIKQKQNTKDIEQTNEDLEEYTKKKTQFVYMFLLILIFLTAIILTLYFIVPNIVNDLILIIYFIGIFSILFYLKGYL